VKLKNQLFKAETRFRKQRKPAGQWSFLAQAEDF
jgi:hypothetical protein